MADEVIHPLRLIDVEATLDGRASGGIIFSRHPKWHVLSHTWSADVREFSTIIGSATTSSGAATSYEALFEAADFGSHPAYLELMDFLTILNDQHVKWVWFDAVCINQKDSVEKDHEIQHMGTYYQNSVACYVLHHGFGRGFKLLPTDPLHDPIAALPRWFTRAWTFQEWLLPPALTFIIDLASDGLLRKTAVNALLGHREKPGSSGCLCCDMSWKFVLPWFLWDCITSDTTQQDFNLAASDLTPCQHFIQIPGKDHWYFSDDVGFAFLLKLKFHIQNADESLGKDSVLLSQAQASITTRMAAKQSVFQARIRGPTSSSDSDAHSTSIHELIVEISERECSNPEDRVLSILKLLGVENILQVRTGKTLQMQLLELGRSLLCSAQDEFLMTICLVDGFGSETPGMSWMPEFEVKKGSWQEEARYLLRWMGVAFTFTDFKFKKALSLRCKDICGLRGELEVEADVCAGELIFHDHDMSIEEYRMERFDDMDKSFYEQYQLRTMVLQVGGQAVFHLCVRVSAQNTCIVQIVDPQERFAYSNVAFPASNIHVLQQIPVWLLGFGDVHNKGMCLLVCVGDPKVGLHKIGYFLGLSPSWFVLNSQSTCCKIGGLGKWNPA